MSAPTDRHDRDDALARAWKAHSTELPPPHVDAAILAAAHREAHAKPESVGERDGDARRPSRVWWPLAAAATIAAIAFGIVELAPPAVDDSTRVATDMPQPSTPPPQADATQATPPPPPMREAARSQDAASAPASKPAKSTPAPAPDMQRERLAKREAKARAPAPRDEATAAVPPPPSGETQPFAREAPEPRSDTGARPFPGAPAESAAAKPSAPSASAPLQASPPAPAAPSPRRQADAREPMAAAGAAAAPDVPVHVRVERIRALHAAGDLDAAARELRALRRSQDDADALLPAQLRAWAASVPREP
jgi:hypothetical protein